MVNIQSGTLGMITKYPHHNSEIQKFSSQDSLRELNLQEKNECFYDYREMDCNLRIN